ncbi:MAG: hypothetical protein L0229_28545 [Blastocatellia bacterium]|nr:hypothetical protein [Blastocatellia bacterium]
MKALTRIFISCTLASLLLCPIATSAQWNKKPYTEWSEKDAQKLLNNSPWARAEVFTDASSMFRSRQAEGPLTGTVGTPQTALHVNFRIRFLSAKPIRMAVKRMTELKQKNDMTPELAANLEAFVNGEFKDLIVVVVNIDSDQQGPNVSEAIGLLQTTGTAAIKNNTFLQVGKERVFLQEYQTPRSDGLGARFIFPRLVDGKPFITPEGKDVRFVAELSPTYKLDERYKIKDMMYGGKLEY